MNAVVASMLAMPMPSASGIGARPKDDRGALKDDAWQRAILSASHESASDGGSAATASRLFDLNAVMAMPAAELPRAPSAPVSDVVAPPGAVGAATPRATAATHAAPVRALAAVASGRVHARGGESNPGGHDASPVASTASGSARGASTGERGSRPASPSREGNADGIRPAVLAAFAMPLARPERAFAAYAQALSAIPQACEAASSFTLASASSIAPVRVHVQWRGRVADVWIGLHRRAFDQLPDIRAGIQDWVASRGGVVGRLICNGERVDGAPTSSTFPGVL